MGYTRKVIPLVPPERRFSPSWYVDLGEQIDDNVGPWGCWEMPARPIRCGRPTWPRWTLPHGEVYAGRVLWIVLVGPLGKSMLYRLCYNKKCVNPIHAEMVDSKESGRRGVSMRYRSGYDSGGVPLGLVGRPTSLTFRDACLNAGIDLPKNMIESISGRDKKRRDGR